MKELFTYIMEFRGGTYTSQVQAISLEDSLMEWTKNLYKNRNEIRFLGEKAIREVTDQLEAKEADVYPTLLKGLTNVWCLTFNTTQGSGLVNIIKTKE